MGEYSLNFFKDRYIRRGKRIIIITVSVYGLVSILLWGFLKFFIMNWMSTISEGDKAGIMWLFWLMIFIFILVSMVNTKFSRQSIDTWLGDMSISELKIIADSCESRIGEIEEREEESHVTYGSMKTRR